MRTKLIEKIKKKLAMPSVRFWMAVGLVKLVILILLALFLWMILPKISFF